MTRLSFILCLLTVKSFTNTQPEMKSYSVKKIESDVSLTGKGEDPAWINAPALADFSYPWENNKPGGTTFKALHNGEWLYCLFQVEDEHIVLAENKDPKAAVASSSRAEIFFRIDDKLTPYYCLELDPAGRVLDYEATYYRKFDSAWSWPRGQMTLKTFTSRNGYSVEFAISMRSLKQLGLLKDHRLEAGLYRADAVREGNNIDNFKWVSWVTPDSKTPDFHIPSSFGLLLLED